MNKTRRTQAGISRRYAWPPAQAPRPAEPVDVNTARAVGKSLIHRPAAQLREDMILGHAFGVRLAELRTHPLPELTKPHGPPSGHAQPVTRVRLPGARTVTQSSIRKAWGRCDECDRRYRGR